ncbi:septin-2 isoform X2 [Labeo rohita]|uniref:Septin-2 isoform X2 n=1 Tax=Labeo rohita TaxID=84645 RepID=A0A498LLK5_LABRO|nr:septin-2 isoform X2 [Labeo rohita]RXN08720.1 septin-2 isoform X2 [Labeo rohita]
MLWFELKMSQADKLKQGQFTNPETPGYVGFANLPNQVHRKSVKKGFEFTLMVVGESGLGKSTLINSLFLTDLYPERVIPGAAEKIERTVQIEASTVEIEERGVKLRLTVVDTPGYGDAINSQDCTHMQDLQEVTQDLHYENFRSERLKRGGRLSSHGYILPMSPAYVLLCLSFFTSSLNLH